MIDSRAETGHAITMVATVIAIVCLAAASLGLLW